MRKIIFFTMLLWAALGYSQIDVTTAEGFGFYSKSTAELNALNALPMPILTHDSTLNQIVWFDVVNGEWHTFGTTYTGVSRININGHQIGIDMVGLTADLKTTFLPRLMFNGAETINISGTGKFQALVGGNTQFALGESTNDAVSLNGLEALSGDIDLFSDMNVSNRTFRYGTSSMKFNNNGSIVINSAFQVPYIAYDSTTWANSTAVPTRRAISEIIEGMAGGGSGDMAKSTYDTDNDGRIDKAIQIDQGGIFGGSYTFSSPSTFPNGLRFEPVSSVVAHTQKSHVWVDSFFRYNFETTKDSELWMRFDFSDLSTNATIRGTDEGLYYHGLRLNQSAAEVPYDDANSSLTSVNVQDAIDEVSTIVDGFQNSGYEILVSSGGSTEINAALATAGSVPVRITVDMALVQPIIIGSNQTFIFEGKTLTVASNFSGDAIIKNAAALDENIHIKGGTIDGSNAANHIYDAIRFQDVLHCSIKNVKVVNVEITASGTETGNIHIINGNYVELKNIESTGTWRMGIRILGGSNNTIKGGFFTETHDSGIAVLNSPFLTLKDVVVDNCGTSDASNVTINMQSAIIDNLTSINASGSVNGNGLTIGHSGFTSDHGKVTNSHFENNKKGIVLQGSTSNIIIDGNVFLNNIKGIRAIAPTSKITITNNIMTNALNFEPDVGIQGLVFEGNRETNDQSITKKSFSSTADKWANAIEKYRVLSNVDGGSIDKTYATSKTDEWGYRESILRVAGAANSEYNWYKNKGGTETKVFGFNHVGDTYVGGNLTVNSTKTILDENGNDRLASTGTNTDNQTLSVTGSNLSISGGNTVSLPTTGGGAGFIFSNRQAPSGSETISSKYPSVTLAEVQALDADATLSDSAAWFYLQEGLAYLKGTGFWVAKDNSIVDIPYNSGYQMSRPLNLDYMQGVNLNFQKCWLNPVSGYTGDLVEITDQVGNGYGHLYINNLKIRGNYSSKGVLIDGVQSVHFTNPLIERCTDAVTYSKTWYGSFDNGALNNNIRAVVFKGTGNYSTSEVNTISFHNLKISAALTADKTNFGVPSDTDTYGYYINGRSLGVNIFGNTIENTDYAIYADDSEDNGIDTSLRLAITNSYFEATGKYHFYFNPTLAASRVDLDFRFNMLNHKNVNGQITQFAFAQGTVNYMDNYSNVYSNPLPQLEILGGASFRMSAVNTDLNMDQIVNNSNAKKLTRIHIVAEKIDSDMYQMFEFSPAGSSYNKYNPDRGIIAKQLQNTKGHEAQIPQQTSDISSQQIYYKGAYQQSHKDISFLDSEKGIVMKDRTTGEFWRLLIDNGTVKVEKELIKDKIYQPVGAKLPAFFVNHTNKSSVSGQFNIEGFPYGKATWTGSQWQVQGIRAIGTTAERPTHANGRFYYDTDISNYVRSNGSSWTINNSQKINLN